MITDPVSVGEIADAANAALYLAEGDYTNAAISAAGMIPFGGQAPAPPILRSWYLESFG